MSNTLTLPTSITWNKLTTRPLTAEEKEEYDQMYGDGVVTCHWDGPTPDVNQTVLVYMEHMDTIETDEWVDFCNGCVGFDTNDDVDTIYWAELPEPPKPF